MACAGPQIETVFRQLLGSSPASYGYRLNLERTLTANYMQSHADYSLVQGWKLKGWPVATIIRGQRVVEDGKVVGKQGLGMYYPLS